ncbi:hypothetical protein PSTG_07575 [Puccinia striiformis f. sp. tritici PST-78]|uniref:Uncharacterized protein n=1 Tax=Puccinia striiformis f. sp. tritici PST-78 TaxID=1165861 RepID=A0A0L0VII2_9BASI|nr:hypothetical protein PSTG_07575 [Puccinia striiformis f. sp. tritici PST-78]
MDDDSGDNGDHPQETLPVTAKPITLKLKVKALKVPDAKAQVPNVLKATRRTSKLNSVNGPHTVLPSDSNSAAQGASQTRMGAQPINLIFWLAVSRFNLGHYAPINYSSVVGSTELSNIWFLATDKFQLGVRPTKVNESQEVTNQ